MPVHSQYTTPAHDVSDACCSAVILQKHTVKGDWNRGKTEAWWLDDDEEENDGDDDDDDDGDDETARATKVSSTLAWINACNKQVSLSMTSRTHRLVKTMRNNMCKLTVAEHRNWRWSLFKGLLDVQRLVGAGRGPAKRASKVECQPSEGARWGRPVTARILRKYLHVCDSARSSGWDHQAWPSNFLWLIFLL